MANRTVTLNMDANVSYTKIAVVYAEVGDTVIATVNGAGSSYHWGEVSGSLPNGSPGWDDHGTTWSYTVVGTDQDADYYVDAMFFSPYNPQDGTAATHSGRVRINVPNPIFTGATADNATAANVTVTLSATPTHVGSSSGETIQYRQQGGSFQNSNTISQARNTTKTYDTRLWTTGPVTFGGVSAAGEGDEYYTRSITVGYIATPSSATLTPSSTSVAVNTAYTLPAVSSNYDTGVVYYLTTVGGSGYSVGTAYTGIWTGYIARTQGSSQFKDKDNLSSTTRTSPSTAGTTTYYAWNLRSTGNGGDGLYYYAGPAFTLTTTANVSVSSFDLGDTYNSGTTLSPVVTRRAPETGTFTVTNGPASASVSGDGSPQFQINGAGNYVTSGTIANGDYVNFKMTGPSGYSGSHTGTLTIGNASDSLVITTGADPGSGGDSSGGAGSPVDYGLAITNSNNTVIFGSNLKSSHVLANAQSASDLAANASSGWIDMEAQGILKADNVASKVGILIISMDSGDENDYASWIVSRDTTTGGGTGNAYGRWAVRNNASDARSYRYIILRY